MLYERTNLNKITQDNNKNKTFCRLTVTWLVFKRQNINIYPQHRSDMQIHRNVSFDQTFRAKILSTENTPLWMFFSRKKRHFREQPTEIGPLQKKEEEDALKPGPSSCSVPLVPKPASLTLPKWKVYSS